MLCCGSGKKIAEFEDVLALIMEKLGTLDSVVVKQESQTSAILSQLEDGMEESRQKVSKEAKEHTMEQGDKVKSELVSKICVVENKVDSAVNDLKDYVARELTLV